MTEQNPQHPPSHSRLFAAAQKGMFPQSELISFGVTLIATGLVLNLAGELLAETFLAGFRNGFQAAFKGEANWAESVRGMWPAIGVVAALLSAIVLPGIFAALIPAARARQSRGSTVAELPKMPTTRAVQITIRSLATVLVMLLWISHWKEALPRMTSLVRLWPQQSTDDGAWLVHGVVSTGLVLFAAGIIELLALRTALWKSLHLDSLQQRRENQMQSGSPHVRERMQSQSRK